LSARLSTSPIPPVSGLYALLLQFSDEESLHVGQLGHVDFKPGYYIYVGSAAGSGGLSARIGYHLRADVQREVHWHIDALTRTGQIIALGFGAGLHGMECAWAEALGESGLRYPRQFGASDCRCGGHLIFYPRLRAARERLVALHPELCYLDALQ
jgi:sugar fermentation stimulation protein A